MNSATPEPGKFADTAFGRIEYLDRGQGPPVLVVHGSPGGHDQGSLMADFLVAAGLRAIIPSRPGYLGSELNEANCSIDGSADALAALMAGLGIDRFACCAGPAADRRATGWRCAMATSSARWWRWPRSASATNGTPARTTASCSARSLATGS